MKTKFLIAAAAVAFGFSSAAKADELFTEQDLGGTFNANVGIVTEYLFRGTSQSGNGNPALQGGIDFNHGSGFYVGTWASSINFGGNVETNLYTGWSGDVGDAGVGLDVGAIYYHYPSSSRSDRLDFWEGYVGVSRDFGMAEAGAKFSYSPSWTGNAGSAQHLEATLDVPAGRFFTVNLAAGYQWFDRNARVGLKDYAHWLAGVSTRFAGFDFQVAWIDSDQPESNLRNAFNQNDSGKLIATLSRTF